MIKLVFYTYLLLKLITLKNLMWLLENLELYMWFLFLLDSTDQEYKMVARITT